MNANVKHWLILIITILLFCILASKCKAQVVYLPMTTAELEMETMVIYPIHIDSTQTDTISVEEQFLKEISDKALAKEERKQKITKRVLIIIIAILLVDKFTN